MGSEGLLDDRRYGRDGGGRGSVLKQALLGHPREGREGLFMSGVLQLQQVAHLADGPQRLAGEQETTLLI